MVVVILFAPIVYWLVIQGIIRAKKNFNERIIDEIKDETKLILIDGILRKKINLRLYHINKIKKVLTSEEFEFIQKQYSLFVQDKVIIALLSFFLQLVIAVLYLFFTKT